MSKAKTASEETKLEEESSLDNNYSKWVRVLILKNPKLSLTEFQEEHQKAGWSHPDLPKDLQRVYMQRNVLAKRWGVDKFDSLPRNKKDNSINVTAMLRLYFKVHGTNVDIGTARKFFAADGLRFVDPVFHKVRVEERKTALSSKSPDPNQDAGPRAGKPVLQSRAPRNSKKVINFEIEKFTAATNLVKKCGGLTNARDLLAIIENAGGVELTRQFLDLIQDVAQMQVGLITPES